ncbi:hypothetical protein Ddc_12307 [Ditylenchus destructor]|nr:hypothetical protein Ddc_12307 [Ditylenchus destructor]
MGGNAIEREAKKKSRTPVEIADDTWLETLRSLSFRQWSKVRFVSRQLNGVAQTNVSTLPCAIIDSASTRLMERNNILSNIIVLDSTIPATDAIQWFKDRDIALDIPKDIQLNNAFIGINLEENRCVDITVLGSAQQKKLSLQNQVSHQASKKEVVFFAEFRPSRNENSWASMTHFLNLLYHPVTYVKELSMYPLDTKLKDTLFAGEERYIRCGLFTFQIPTDDGNFRKPLSWLEKNVRAETIDFSNVIEMIDQEEISNFFFDASWKCAKQEVKLGEFEFVRRIFSERFSRGNAIIHGIIYAVHYQILNSV